MVEPFFSSGLFTYVVVPLLIFGARICDMSMDTVRVIFMSKGIKYLPSVIGFFEVIIWLVAIGQVMNNLTNVVCYIRLRGGVCHPGRLSGWRSRRNSPFGLTSVRIITKEEPSDLIRYLRAHDYGVTVMNGEGKTGPVKIVFTIIKRKDLNNVVAHRQAVPPPGVLFDRGGQVGCRRRLSRKAGNRGLWLDQLATVPPGEQVSGPGSVRCFSHFSSPYGFVTGIP
jgi:Uncharacterized protein conserved in bacteria